MTQDVSGKRVLVMGLGRFGGGLGVTRWLVEQGADVLLTDLLGEEELREQLTPLQGDIAAGQVTLRLGGHETSDFTETDLVVASPAVPKPWRNPYLKAAEQVGVPVTTEIGLVLERISVGATIIAVTGSAGKSTTSAMIAHGLRSTGSDVFYGGNIGGSLLPELPRMSPDCFVVLELSSAMLWWLKQTLWSRGAARGADVAVVTNFSANHIDWHGSLEHYAESKQALLQHQPMGAAAIFGPGLDAAWEPRESVRRIRIHDDDAARVATVLPGRHNKINAAVALAACRAAGADPEQAGAAIAAFGGLPHRLQFVGASAQGVRYYNDSKSTVPEASVLAVEAVRHAVGPEARIHLLAGGYDKGLDLEPIVECLRTGFGRLYTMGATGAILAGMAKAAGIQSSSCETVEQATESAAEHARPGDCVLLSPGCASWDQFANYEQRGEVFVNTARRIMQTNPQGENA